MTPTGLPTPSHRDLLVRALRLRCPWCGRGPVFLRWLAMCPSCPTCGLRFDREPEGGYWIGSYTINLMLTEAVLAVAMVGTLVLTWPDVPWRLLVYLDAGLMLTVPIFFFPFTKTLFIAVDLIFRPDEPGDFAEPHEASPASLRHPR